MALIGNISLNTGQNINIPDIEWGKASIIGLNQNFWYYSNGNNPATNPFWYDIVSKINSKGAIADSWSGVYNLFMDRSSHPATYWNSGAGKVWLDNVREHTYFIFGSLDNGGVFICKDSGNRYYIIAFRGTFNDDSTLDDDYAYWFQGVPGAISDGLTRTELESAYFLQYDPVNGYPKLWLFYTPDGLGWRKQSFDGRTGIGSYEGTTLSDCLAISNWKDCLPVVSLSGMIPEYMFVCSDVTGETIYSSQGYKAIGSDGEGVYPQYSHRAGSILGGSKINSEDNPYNSTSTTSPTGDPWDDSSDPINPTDDTQFTTDAINSGFYTLYNPDKTQIQAFNNYLFTDITDAMAQVLKRLIADPIEYVVFCAMCHFTPPSSGTSNISFCGLDSGISAKLISKQMHYIDCGSVDLFYYKNGMKLDDTASFLSYDPYYKIDIYLPYIGIKSLNTKDAQCGTVSVGYWVDLLTGACIAQVSVDRSSRITHDAYLHAVIAEFTGNCYEHLPMSSTDWRGMVTSIMQFAGGLGSVATGNAAGLGAMASAVMAEKVQVSRSGQLAANYGYMGKQKPYLIISRPINQTPSNFKSWEGLPSNITYQLGELHGYTELDPDTLWTDGFDGILEEEAQMIREITSKGFYI